MPNLKQLLNDDFPFSVFTAGNTILEKVDRGDVLDEYVLHYWVKKYYPSFQKKNNKAKQDFKNFSLKHASFEDFCMNEDASSIHDLMVNVLNDIRFFQIIPFFKILVKKNGYTKHHFKNQHWIARIHVDCLNIIAQKSIHSFHDPALVFHRIDDIYFWSKISSEQNVIIDEKSMFLYNDEFQLRRCYIETDEEIFRDTGYEKILAIIYASNKKFILNDRILDNYKTSVLKFMLRMTDYDIDLKNISSDNYDICTEYFDVKGLIPPLKILIHNRPKLLRELREQINYGISNLKIDSGKVWLTFRISEIFKFINYCHNMYVNDEIDLMIKMSLNKTSLSKKAEDVWTTLIDMEEIAKYFNFAYTNAKLQYFRKYFISDYMLTNAFYDYNLEESRIVQSIKKAFNVHHEFGTYSVDMTPFIISILEYNNAEYLLPLNGFLILDDYFKIHNKKYLDDDLYYTGDMFSAAFSYDPYYLKNTVTDLLIAEIESQYSKDLIANELFNI